MRNLWFLCGIEGLPGSCVDLVIETLLVGQPRQALALSAAFVHTHRLLLERAVRR